MPALGAAEGELRGALGRLFAVAEAYPDLKTNETFRHLQGRISGLENAIADRREFYNESVNVNNVRIEQFPDSIVAAIFSFRSFELLKFSSEQTRDVDMKELFPRLAAALAFGSGLAALTRRSVGEPRTSCTGVLTDAGMLRSRGPSSSTRPAPGSRLGSPNP